MAHKPEIPIKIIGRNISVEVPDCVRSLWYKYRQNTFRQPESCGVIIGGFNAKENRVIIDHCTEPKPGDVLKRRAYILQDPEHQQVVDNYFHDSEGYSHFLGIWHTHPEPFPAPSAQDRIDWANVMKVNQGIVPAFLFAIVGNRQISLFPYIQRNNIL